jgi:hypothetical protein
LLKSSLHICQLINHSRTSLIAETHVDRFIVMRACLA